MLSELELKTLDFVFRTSSKFSTVPYIWNKGKLSLKSNQHYRVSNGIIWLLLVPTIIYKIIQLPSLFRNITGSIFQSYLLFGLFANATCKLNIAIYKTELAELVNQILYINSVWGKSYYFIFKVHMHSFNLHIV